MVMKFVETDKVDLMVGGIEWETKLIVKRTASDLKQHFFGWCLVLCLSVCPFLLMWFTFISFSFIYFYFKWCCSQLSIESDRLSLLLLFIYYWWSLLCSFTGLHSPSVYCEFVVQDDVATKCNDIIVTVSSSLCNTKLLTMVHFYYTPHYITFR
jgi:hypothetical protein